VPLRVNGYLTYGHVAIITETDSTYVMIESTLRFDGVEDIPRFSRWFKGHVCGQENGAGDGLGMRLAATLFAPFGCTHPHPPVPPFLLVQSLCPKDIAGSDTTS